MSLAFALTLILAALLPEPSIAGGRRTQPPVNAQAATMKAFTDRVAQYVDLHNKVAGTLPPLGETSDAAELSGREKALANALARARAKARFGDIFGADFRPIARRLLRADWARRSAADRRALLADVPSKARLRVNMPYPAAYPLLTVPSKLLAQLPDLPDELEYRLFGRHLILRDTTANIIVDALIDVLPAVS